MRQLTLGEVIKTLEQYDPSCIVEKGFTYPHSYRGYYSELAFELEENTTVGKMLEACKSTMNRTFEGYKGGEFGYNEDTLCWIADYGRTGETLGELLLSLMLKGLK